MARSSLHRGVAQQLQDDFDFAQTSSFPSRKIEEAVSAQRNCIKTLRIVGLGFRFTLPHSDSQMRFMVNPAWDSCETLQPKLVVELLLRSKSGFRMEEQESHRLRPRSSTRPETHRHPKMHSPAQSLQAGPCNPEPSQTTPKA